MGGSTVLPFGMSSVMHYPVLPPVYAEIISIRVIAVDLRRDLNTFLVAGPCTA